MKHLTKSDIAGMDRLDRLNLINSITGIKPANLVGTIGADKTTNLAIFSSVLHLGSHPALIGFVVRPGEEVRRHTYENIVASGQYTINHVHIGFTEKAHYTSAKFKAGDSEFEACGFTEAYVTGFDAPFVEESMLRLGLAMVEDIPIKRNGTRLVIGEVVHAFIPEDAIEENGHLNLEIIGTAGISGLNSYYSLKKEAIYPYARVSELPWRKK